MKGWLSVLVAFLLCVPAMALEEIGEECVDFTPERIKGIGGWLLHGDMGLSIRFWTRKGNGLEVCVLAPAGGGRSWVLGKSLYRLLDTCYLDGYVALGAGIPVGGSIDWQLIDLSLGIEFGLPEVKELTFVMEIGVSLIHYYHCHWWGCEWSWRSASFSGIGFQYYF